ncbi:hypothetical protein LX36DRAFT_745122 [Colletotrichum falcatum]|nr:hypothetical protein LX36DRAFT_745122 [Colletotrichum falcatum]
MARSIWTLVVLAGLASAGVAPRQNAAGVDITTLNKTVEATSGTGEVSAAGTLAPFGQIGVGCGVNWEEGQSYGGGLQSGSDSFGLGGGFNITEDKMTIGLGIGLVGSQGLNTSVNYEVSTNGSATITFTSTKGLTCQQTTINGLEGFQCTSL